MARSAEALVRELLGSHALQIATLTARVEALTEELDLKQKEIDRLRAARGEGT